MIRSALFGLALLGGMSCEARLLPNLNAESAQLRQQSKMELAQTTIDLPVDIPGLPDQVTIPDLPVDVSLPTIDELPGLVDSIREAVPDWLEELLANQTLSNSTLDLRLPEGFVPNITWPGYPSPPNATYDEDTDTVSITVGPYAVALSNLNLTGPPELHVDVDAVWSDSTTNDENDGVVVLHTPTLLINDQEYNASAQQLNTSQLIELWNSLSAFEGLSIPSLGIEIPALGLPRISQLSGLPSELGYTGLVNLSLPGWTGGLPHVELFGFENWTSSLEKNDNGSVSIILPPFLITIPREYEDVVGVVPDDVSSEAPHHTDCKQNDLVALNYLLFLKRLQVAHYADALEYLTSNDFVEAGATNLTFERFQEIYGQDQQHAAMLEALLQEREAETWNECNYTFNFGEEYNSSDSNVQATVGFAQRAQFLENVASSAYVGVSGLFTEEELGSRAASMSMVDARHSSWINPLLGASPFPDSFEPAANASDVYSLVESLVSGCAVVDEPLTPVTRDECEGASFTGTWSAWHACSVSCGGGQTYRDCLVDGQISENSNCRGRVTQPCNEQEC